MLKTPYGCMVVQLSGLKLGQRSFGPGFESHSRENFDASFLTSLYSCQNKILQFYGTDYRPLLEFVSRALYPGLYNSGGSKCLDIRVRCTEASLSILRKGESVCRIGELSLVSCLLDSGAQLVLIRTI